MVDYNVDDLPRYLMSMDLDEHDRPPEERRNQHRYNDRVPLVVQQRSDVSQNISGPGLQLEDIQSLDTDTPKIQNGAAAAAPGSAQVRINLETSQKSALHQVIIEMLSESKLDEIFWMPIMEKIGLTSPDLIKYVKPGSKTYTTLVTSARNEIETDILNEFLDNLSKLNQEEASSSSKITTDSEILGRYGLEKFFPGKLGIEHFDIGLSTNENPNSLQNMPMKMIQNIMHCDSTSICTALQVNHEEDDEKLHPLDLFVVVFKCCNPVLQQRLITKMYHCRMALPFALPLKDESFVCHVWPLKAIASEWTLPNGDPICEQLTEYPAHIISVLKVGSPSLSKSKLLNDIIQCKTNQTFYNYELPNGTNEKHSSAGLIEMSNYLPANKPERDAFPQHMIFMNLRGDGLRFKQQTMFLQKVSTLVIVLIDIEKITQLAEEITNSVLRPNSLVVLTTNNNAGTSADVNVRFGEKMYDDLLKRLPFTPKLIKSYHKHRQKSSLEISNEIKSHIKSLDFDTEKHTKSLGKICREMCMTGSSILLDEMQNYELNKAMLEAKTICNKIGEVRKEDLIPLQGLYWHEYSKIEKEMYRTSTTTDGKALYEVQEELQKKLIQIRSTQKIVAKNPSIQMTMFMNFLRNNIENRQCILYFVQEIKILLDQQSRLKMGFLQHKFDQYINTYTAAKQGKDSLIAKDAEVKMKDVRTEMHQTSLGFAHFIRELGQLYEASPMTYASLPRIAAHLLMYGICMEIVDGDACSLPLSWIKAVFNSLKNLIGDKRIFVIATLGVQSSGKSTLLNTMFGLEFPANTGRVTKGIDAQLLPVSSTKFPFDFILVLDTEGLRAPEFGSDRIGYDHELATFIVGLADLLLVNIKGENITEMRDILEITVHALIRMKCTNQQHNRRCIFLHQNVGGVNAEKNMMSVAVKMLEDLDCMTREAAKAENCPKDNLMFSDILNFNPQEDIAFLSDLWNGPPPMAPIDIGYSYKVAEIKNTFLQRLIEDQPLIMKLSDVLTKISDIWTAILSDEFIFSFRNSIDMKAHMILESRFSEIKYKMEQLIWDEIRKEEALLRKCTTLEKLDPDVDNSIAIITKKMNVFLAEAIDTLNTFFDDTDYKENLEYFREQKKDALRDFADNEKAKVERRLYDQRDYHYKDLLKIGRLEDHRLTFMKDAIRVAKQLDEYSSQEKLDEEFYNLWKNVEPEPEFITVLMVRKRMEAVLLRELSLDGRSIDYVLLVVRDDKNTSKSFVNGIDEGYITDDVFNIKDSKGLVKRFTNFFRKSDERPKARRLITTCINKCLQNILKILDNICDKQDKKYFYIHCEEFVHGSLELFDKAMSSLSDHENITITPTLKSRFVSHAVNYAILRYETLFESNTQVIRATSETKEIRMQMEKILIEEFKTRGREKSLQGVLKFLHEDEIPLATRLGNSINENDIKESFIQFNVGFEYLSVNKMKVNLKESLNDAMRILDSKLEIICCDDSRFFKTHGTKLVKEILKIFSDFNQQESKAFVFTWDCIAFYAVMVAHHAVLRFEAMNIKYDVRYGRRALLENYKSQAKTLFKDQVHKVADSVTFATIFCNTVRISIEDIVASDLARKIKSKVVGDIGFSKQELIVKILSDLAAKKDFKSFTEYIYSASEFSTRWLKDYIDDVCFEEVDEYGNGYYGRQANYCVDSYVESVLETVRTVTDKISREKALDVSKETWLKMFCEMMKKTNKLSFDENDFLAVKDLKVVDFKILARLIEEKMSTLQNAMQRKFGLIDATSVNWGNEQPEVHVMKILWGCKEQCPFCEEPCKKTNANHSGPHECTQHRPKAVTGSRDSNKNPLLEICSLYVTSNTIYYCSSRKCKCRKRDKSNKENLGKKPHLHKDYKKYHPNWDIAPDTSGQASYFWKWFLCTFKYELAKYHMYTVPVVPYSWGHISKQMAIENLRQGMS